MSNAEIVHPSGLAVDPQKRMRLRTFMELQPFILGYGVGLTVFTPYALLHQLKKLHPEKVVTSKQSLSLCAKLFPTQVAMRVVQMNLTTPIKENLSPWAAFGFIGVIQGAVYGQANIFMAREIGIAKAAMTVRGVFRGSGFAAGRDIISQGIPFMCSDQIRKIVFDRALPTLKDSQHAQVLTFAKHWGALLSTSVVSTVASQCLNICQTTMQVDQSLSYAGALREVWHKHGISAFYKGSSARIGMLLAVNVMNELILKPAWSPIEMTD